MKNRQGGSAQQRRRARRAALRAQMNPRAVEAATAADIAAIGDLATSAAPAEEPALPEVLALERLDAQLGTAASAPAAAVVRLILPEEAAHEASALLATRLRVAVDGEESADFGAAVAARFAQIVDELRATFTLTDFEVAMPDDLQPASRLPDANASPAEPAAPVAPDSGVLRWTATIAPEGAMTDDGRAFAPDALQWRELPLTLGAMLDTPHADMVTEARAAGRIDRIWREGGVLKAEGIFDAGEFGQEIARMVNDGTLRGVSVDTAIHSYEVGPRSQWFDADGNWLATPEAPAEDEEPQDLVQLLFGGPEEDTIYVITSATIGAVTICPFAAFADAKISVADSLVAGASPGIWTITQQAGFTVVHDPAGDAPSLTASAALLEAPADVIDLEAFANREPEETLAAALGIAPLAPPAEWFDNPNLTELTPVTIDDDGRIYGHAWGWSTCHIGYPDSCTTAPGSNTGYAYFHVGEIVCADGERVSVGRLTFDTGHAAPRLSRAAAAAHYDDTGKVGGYVVVGEDEHGGWIAGTLAADVTAVDAQKLRGSAPSGDWRDANGNLELVALLAVNVPGFPVPRPRALTASGEEGDVRLSLTAAGIVLDPDDDTLFRIGLEDAVRDRLITPDFRDLLTAAGETAPEQRLEMIDRGRDALARHRAEQEADLREMRALAEQARGTFSDLAQAAREEA